MEKITKREKVSIDKINRLQQQKVEKNEVVDVIDAGDRACGRIFSKLGRFIEENF